jgi:hypothetical protein
MDHLNELRGKFFFLIIPVASLPCTSQCTYIGMSHSIDSMSMHNVATTVTAVLRNKNTPYHTIRSWLIVPGSEVQTVDSILHMYYTIYDCNDKHVLSGTARSLRLSLICS